MTASAIDTGTQAERDRPVAEDVMPASRPMPAKQTGRLVDRLLGVVADRRS